MKSRRKTRRAIALAALVGLSSTASAKSLYVIADINASPTPINTYNINPDGSITFQSTASVPRLAGGAVGLAIDTTAEVLFVTYEVSNTIQLLDATTFADLGTATAPGASNLAGIVVDQGKSLLYTVDRNTPNLYVYDWNPATTTLTLQAGFPIALPGASRLHGLDLDETSGTLYASDILSGEILGYDTTTWTSVSSFTPTDVPGGVAVDSVNGLLYSTAPDGGCSTVPAGTNIVSQIDIATATEVTSSLGSHGGFGVSVDESTGVVYVSGGCSGDNVTAWDPSTVPFTQLSDTGDIGNPTGLVGPRAEVSFNPLNLTKTDRADPVASGSNVTYDICFDNTQNETTVDNVTLTDQLPTGTTFVSATDGGVASGNTVIWSIGTLIAGAPRQCVGLTLQINAPEGSVVTNSVTIESDQTAPTTTNEDTTVGTAALPTAIPTLSEWGMILLSGLLAIWGIVAVRRHRAN